MDVNTVKGFSWLDRAPILTDLLLGGSVVVKVRCNFICDGRLGR